METPLGNLSEFMRWFNITYTSHYNRRQKRVGHLYQGRYKSVLVEKDAYLYVLSRYIHLNPVRIPQIEKASLSEKKKYLKNYKWSSLSGYISDSRKNSFTGYAQVLEPYGGDTKEGRKRYWEIIRNDLAAGVTIKEKVIGQSIMGSSAFIDWVRETFLPEKSREIPAVKHLKRYKTKEEIMNALCKGVGKEFHEIIGERGIFRQIAMDLLYRLGGLKGPEIGEMMGIDYSTVSQGRKRLREKLIKDKRLCQIVKRIEYDLSF